VGVPAQPIVFYIGANNNGVYRSDDAGESWTRVSKDHRLCGRGSDFAEARVHLQNSEFLVAIAWAWARTNIVMSRWIRAI
jgi:hypothetical protein